MAVDGAFEQESILLRAKTLLVGGRVFSSVPDDTLLERNAAGAFKPYVVVSFGSAYAATGAAGERSLMGEEEQPFILPIRMQAWASNDAAARATAGAIRDEFIGWIPSPGSSEIRSGGGGSSFTNRGAGASPTRFTERILLETTINLGSNDGYVPTPGGDTDEGGGTAVETIRQIVLETIGEVSQTYERHDFSNPVGQWSMVHAFGRIPSIATYTTTGERVITDEVATSSAAVITWASPTAGFAILT